MGRTYTEAQQKKIRAHYAQQRAAKRGEVTRAIRGNYNAPESVSGDFDDMGRGNVAGAYHYAQKASKGRF